MLNTRVASDDKSPSFKGCVLAKAWLLIDDCFSGGAIPDAAAIYLARKKRQAAREGRTDRGSPAAPDSKDYLPLKKDSGYALS